MNLIEIEPDTATNQELHFTPLGRNIRGRFDYNRVAEPMAAQHTREFPNGIPGQRLTLDLDSGEAAIVEPLHDPAYRDIRQKIEKRGMQLPPERQTFQVDAASQPTWLWWIRNVIESGLAKLTRGTLPEKITGDIRKRFIVNEQTKDPRDSRIDKLLALLYAKLSPAERKSVDELLSN